MQIFKRKFPKKHVFVNSAGSPNKSSQNANIGSRNKYVFVKTSAGSPN